MAATTSANAASKDFEAFRTISEVADDLDVPKHVLRFWEQKFPQLRPMKRGGGRRYYRPEDTRLLRGIRALLYRDGYTIKGVQRILREQGIDSVKSIGEEADAATTRVTPEMPPRASRTATKTTARRAGHVAGVQRDLIVRTIAELEACRELLKAGLIAPQGR